MGEIGIYIAILAFQAVCLISVLAALAAVRALGRSAESTGAPPQRRLAALDLAASRLAEAVREAEALRSGLRDLAARSVDASERAENGGTTAPADGPTPAVPAGAALPALKVASPRIREGFDAVRKLLETGASLQRICEQTGLSESEARFIVDILKPVSKHVS